MGLGWEGLEGLAGLEGLEGLVATSLGRATRATPRIIRRRLEESAELILEREMTCTGTVPSPATLSIDCDASAADARASPPERPMGLSPIAR